MTHRIAVIGTGYLGTAHAAGLAELGFDVLGLDVNPEQVAALRSRRLPFFEPGLAELLERGMASGRLRFTMSYQEAAEFADVFFVCVGTPQREGSDSADLSMVYGCVEALAPLLDRPGLIVGKSTVPAGTAAALAERVGALSPCGDQVELAWNPEFLREGHAVEDTLRPDRIVAGVTSPRAEAILREIYAGPIAAGVPFLVTGLATAEIVKAAANAFLATKISFINAIAEVCEAAGADAVKVAQALGHDARIGPGSMHPGVGFGGGCLPKDLRAFLARAGELGAGQALAFLREVDAINLRRRARAVALAGELAGGSLAGRAVTVLGAAFKPGSDDIRDSPALAVAEMICDLGATVTVHDPVAMGRARQAHPRLRYADATLAAAADADVVLLLTEWPEFRDLDPEELGKVVGQRNIVDGRNVLDRARWEAASWCYRAPGQP